MTLYIGLIWGGFSAGFVVGALWVLYRVKVKYIVLRDFGPEW